jgi:hypothetical protein
MRSSITTIERIIQHLLLLLLLITTAASIHHHHKKHHHNNSNMSWRCSGVSNSELVNNLVRNGLIKSDRVRNAFLAVDRAHFCKTDPYMDAPQVRPLLLLCVSLTRTGASGPLGPS